MRFSILAPAALTLCALALSACSLPYHHRYGRAMTAESQSTAQFPDMAPNRAALVADQPVSTFSVDVDTASYAYVRGQLAGGRLPVAGAVRVEEMVNYFPYKYAAPELRSRPFAVTTEIMPSPWKAGNQLLHIGVRGYDIPATERPPANVVLLIDVS